MPPRLVLPAALLSCALSSAALAQGSRPTSRPASGPASQRTTQSLASKVAQAHGVAKWQAKQAVQAKIKVAFGGSTILDGTMLYEPSSSRCRIELSGGQVLVFDGQEAYFTGSMPEGSPPPRFHLLTWSYFLAAPFKLGDPGSTLTPTNAPPMPKGQHETAKLTFGQGVGDAPDDWYVAYAEKGSSRLDALAYIVTYGKGKEAAEKEPHAIVYGGYKKVSGVQLATDWAFHDWNADAGFGKQIGSAKLSRVRFVTPKATSFAKPKGAKIDKLPQ